MKLKTYLFASTALVRPPVFDETPLKAFHTKEEEIPEAHKDFYVKKGERWELNVAIDGVDGVKSFTDFEKLNSALRKERSDHKVLRDKFKPIADRDVSELLTAADRITELEEELAAASGENDPKKIDKIVEARIKARLAPLERERDKLKTDFDTATNEVKTFKTEKATRTIHDAIREAGTKAKLLPEALEDALMLGERIFEIDDSGKVVVKEGTAYGIGLNAAGWLTEMQEKRPHWWGPSSGGGAGGGRGGNGVTKNPWTSENWNMTEQSMLYTSDPTKAGQLAAAAGTTIGGMRPAAKK
jgi:hypothetical protein